MYSLFKCTKMDTEMVFSYHKKLSRYQSIGIDIILRQILYVVWALVFLWTCKRSSNYIICKILKPKNCVPFEGLDYSK